MNVEHKFELDPLNEYSFVDKNGHPRNEIRVRWWEDSSKATYKRYSILEDVALPDMPVPLDGDAKFYGAVEIPVFFGHYWLTSEPGLFRENVCCLDYSVAKGGRLVAYRFNGERTLSLSGFCY